MLIITAQNKKDPSEDHAIGPFIKIKVAAACLDQYASHLGIEADGFMAEDNTWKLSICGVTPFDEALEAVK